MSKVEKIIMKEVMLEERNLNPEMWQACAGGDVHLPRENSKVFYFPQGHAEHTIGNVDFGALPNVPPMILCRVVTVKRLADPKTDEVYAKIGLIPVGNNESAFDAFDEDGILGNTDEGPSCFAKTLNQSDANNGVPSCFAKTLTQSDANNGGGFSVPRFCAETIFPQMDLTLETPIQSVSVRDVHGVTWQFRHIFRGTPRRHLLTTGWSNFVNKKKLIAGDSIVFLKAKNGDLCVGIRRAKRVGCVGGKDPLSMWSSGNFEGFSSFIKEDENKQMYKGIGSVNLRYKGKVKPESVVESAFLAASGKPFEVSFYPHAGTPEFIVKASSVIENMRTQWCSGTRFKMAFETDDASRTTWYMGTITSAKVHDPLQWPNSCWRLLQVSWDEAEIMKNVKCVNPWLVHVNPNVPVLHMSPLSPARKRMRLLHHPEFRLDGQLPMPSFSGTPPGSSSPMSCLSNNITAGIQGARHAQIGIPLLDLHFNNTLQTGGQLTISYPRPNLQVTIPNSTERTTVQEENENVSCVLSMGNSGQRTDRPHRVKTPRFLLFGQPILTEQQLCEVSEDTPNSLRASSSSGEPWRTGFPAPELGLDTRHCKVFLESEDLGWTLDLSKCGSYEELYRMLEYMFSREGYTAMMSHVLYWDSSGAMKNTGDVPFSEFIKTAKRLTIFKKPSNGGGGAERQLITGLPITLDSSNRRTGAPLTIFA